MEISDLENRFRVNTGIARDNSAEFLKEGEHMSPDHNLFQCGHPDCIRDASSLGKEPK